MNITLAKRLDLIPEYIHSRLNREVKHVEKISGKKVLNFGQGSPDIKPSQKHIEKLIEFIQEEKAHMYPGYTAIPQFSQALQSWYKKRFDVILATDELDILLGGKDGISHLPLALFDAGDEVLIPDPGYPAYKEPTELVGAIPIVYDLIEENDFKINYHNIKSKLTKKTKAIWVNFPSNPTGQVIEKKELEALVMFAKEHNLIVLYDNAYADLTFDGFRAPSILEVPGAKECAIEIGSFSKTFSFAGYRIGWIVGNKTVVAGLAKIKSQMDSGLSLPFQKLGAYALTHVDEDWYTKTIALYQKRRDSIEKILPTLGLTFESPKGGMFIWAKIPDTAISSEDFCMKLLHEKKILFTPGSAFGINGDRYVRISIAVNLKNIDDYFSV